MTDNHLTLEKEAGQLAQQLFGDDIKKCARFTNRLLDICTKAQGKNLILIHNPGGWGDTPLEQCLKWERSIVEGISTTIENLGYSWLLIQYFRSDNSWWSHMQDMREQFRFSSTGKSAKARVMSAELKFIVQHINNIKIILIGVSQGAGFSNTVIQQLGELRQIYSVELGTFFPYMRRRVITERTLAIDSNGVVPDPVVQWCNRNLRAGFKAYITAPFRWLKYRMQGKPEKFTYCINVPGHDYNWEYPTIRQKITDFLEINLGTKSKLEVRS